MGIEFSKCEWHPAHRMQDPNHIVGERLIQIRTMLGLNQRQFADKLGIKANTLSEMEKGRRALSKGVATKIRDKVRVPRDWLYEGNTDGMPAQLIRDLDAAKTRPGRAA